MKKTLVTKLDVSVERQELEIFCRTIKTNFTVETVGEDKYCRLCGVGGNGRVCIISAKEGDIITFEPMAGYDSTTAYFAPLTEMPEAIENFSVKAAADKTNTTVNAATPLSYTIPAETKCLIFYKAYSVTESHNIYPISVKKNGYMVRIPDLDLW